MKRPRRAIAPIGRTPKPKATRSHPIYHTNRWRKESKEFLAASDGFCAICKAKGILTEATVTDHIIPLIVCDDPWDHTNWQPVCSPCNRHKGRTTDKIIIANHKS